MQSLSNSYSTSLKNEDTFNVLAFQVCSILMKETNQSYTIKQSSRETHSLKKPPKKNIRSYDYFTWTKVNKQLFFSYLEHSNSIAAKANRPIG